MNAQKATVRKYMQRGKQQALDRLVSGRGGQIVKRGKCGRTAGYQFKLLWRLVLVDF